MIRAFLVVLLLLAVSGCATLPELGPAEFSKVVPGKTTASEVRSLLGAPSRTLPWPIGQGETWAYPYRGDYDRRVFWVEMSREGVVRATSDSVDLDSRPYRF